MLSSRIIMNMFGTISESRIYSYNTQEFSEKYLPHVKLLLA